MNELVLVYLDFIYRKQKRDKNIIFFSNYVSCFSWSAEGQLSTIFCSLIIFSLMPPHTPWYDLFFCLFFYGGLLYNLIAIVWILKERAKFMQQQVSVQLPAYGWEDYLCFSRIYLSVVAYGEKEKTKDIIVVRISWLINRNMLVWNISKR